MPAPRHEAQDLRHVTVHKTYMTPASSVVTEPTAARKRVGVDPQGKAEVWRGGEGGGGPLFCGRFPEKVYGMEDCTVTETG